jgi:hypothetical protein
MTILHIGSDKYYDMVCDMDSCVGVSLLLLPAQPLLSLGYRHGSVGTYFTFIRSALF